MLVLAAALRLGPKVKPFTSRIRDRIQAHIKADLDARRAKGCAVTVDQVAFLLRVQSFRCLICDSVMHLTNTLPDDPFAMSIGRIWNEHSHTFSNTCLVCRQHNAGDNELKAMQYAVGSLSILDTIKDELGGGLPTSGFNVVVEHLAPASTADPTADMNWVQDWVHSHESYISSDLEHANTLLTSIGFGTTKRELEKALAVERDRQCKRPRISDDSD